jgi:hypothetical protein
LISLFNTRAVSQIQSAIPRTAVDSEKTSRLLKRCSKKRVIGRAASDAGLVGMSVLARQAA